MSRRGAPFHCTFEDCPMFFYRSDRLANHLRTHTGERPFSCKYPECKKAFANSQHLKRHELTHESSFNCTVEGCSEVFKRKDALKRHIDNFHHNKTPKQYKCTECDKQFNKHNWLQRHLYRHTGKFPYICEFAGCGKGFLLPTKLRRHMKSHEARVCQFPGCDATFFKWSLYVAHLKGFHPTVHKCNICERQFSHPLNLKTHLEMHKEPLSRKVFACEVPNCPRYYFEEKNLKFHVETYHEARPHVCGIELCHKAYKTQEALDHHSLRHGRRIPRKKKKRKPSISAVLSGIADPRKFVYTKTRTLPKKRKRVVSESTDAFTTDGEIEYQDTSSEDNNEISASEVTSSSEQVTCHGPTSTIDPHEMQSCSSVPDKEKECIQMQPELSDLSEIAGPSTIAHDNIKLLSGLPETIEYIILQSNSMSSKLRTVADNCVKTVETYIGSEEEHIKSHSGHIESEVDHMVSKDGNTHSEVERMGSLNQHVESVDDHIQPRYNQTEPEVEQIESSNKHLECASDHIESAGEHIKSKGNQVDSGDDPIHNIIHSGNEDDARSSEYETIKVTMLGNVCVWEKCYSGSDDVSSCLSEAEDMLNCGDVLSKRER